MNELDLVLDGWSALEPSPGFAERVVAAMDPAARQPKLRRWPLVAAAVAMAVVLLPLLTPRPHAAPALAHVEDLDAGLRTD
jgi:hypothetical protein